MVDLPPPQLSAPPARLLHMSLLHLRLPIRRDGEVPCF